SWLAGKAGPTGTVLATDIDTSRLDTVARPPGPTRVHTAARTTTPPACFRILDTSRVPVMSE
ncbi:SAM-dependent methyltransferase, partial [Streptomyces griseoluteus]